MAKEKYRIVAVIGTRPEVIKMAPVISELRKHDIFDITILNTAQHRSLLDDMLSIFNITPDIDLNVMQENQSLATLSGNLFLKMEDIFSKHQFDVVLAQGDTTTTLISAQIAFYHHIPFGHIEAGLRSYNFRQPYPEEMNRVFVSQLSQWNYAPTVIEKDNLLKEGIPEEKIFVTGNTVIDSLYLLSHKNTPLPFPLDKNKRLILVTLHRRESFGEPIKHILLALKQLAETFTDIEIIYPVHPNPNVHLQAEKILGHQPRIRLCPPLGYDQFVSLMNRAYFIMSDSGGIQEEAPALNKPILVLRNVTERPLIIDLGLGILVGDHTEKIFTTAAELLSNPTLYQRMQKNLSPYGDGHAAKYIVDSLVNHVSKDI